MERITTDTERPSAGLRACMEIHALRYFSEMSTDPLRDVIHSQRADALEASYLILHGPVKFIVTTCSLRAGG